MKKQKQKKAGAKKEDKAEPASESSKKEDKPEPPKGEAKEGPPEDANGNEEEAGDMAGEDSQETKKTRLLDRASHGRQPSLSVQSKIRSSSFRQSSVSGGPLSPSYGFSPEGDTAPDIHRKQAIKIEELERENKRLAKEASDGEKRWKKAEEELEDLRDAEDDTTSKAKSGSTTESSGELEKLVSFNGLKFTYKH
jgi:vacuolar-type H+-ATPase subunit I/STV1